MIKNLIYDFGKVLVDYDFDLFFRNMIPDDSRRIPFSTYINNPERVSILDRGMKTLEDIVEDFILDFPGYDAEFREFARRKPEVVLREFPGMHELLVKLKSEGFRLYGLSNWDTQVYATINQFDIFKLLDGRIISSEEHEIKPEPEIYLRLFKKFGLKPEECIFADDKPINIEGGRSVGMEGIVFRDAAQYEAELRLLLGSR